MNKRRLRAPSPALVISLIALFVALGGTTYAATSLPKNSVGTKQLKNGAVTKKKINEKALSALKGNRGPQGAPGSQGQIGPSNGYFSSSNSNQVTLSLPAGDYVLYGFAQFFNPNTAGQDQTGCSLGVMGPGTVTTTTNYATISDNNGYLPVSDQGVAHLPSASQIINGCYYTLSGTTVNTAVTAIKVSTVTP